MAQFQRIEIAKAHLHRAIVLFIEEQDFINAITLAGAAEEVLGRFVRGANLTTAMDQIVGNLCRKLGGSLDEKKIRNDHLNRVKNSLKHFEKGDDELIEIEAEEEAISMIVRAMSNLVLIEGQLTEHSKIFYEFLKERRSDLFEDSLQTNLMRDLDAN